MRSGNLAGTDTGYAMAMRRRRPTGGLRSAALLLLLLLATALGAGASARAATLEDQVKAAFLFNFATFVQWPQEGEAAAEAPFVIGILGEDPFGPVIDEIVAGEQVNGRAFVVQRYARVEDIGPCQILFVGRSQQHRLPEALQRVEGQAVLTVGDTPEFAESGGMIEFFTDHGRVQFSINRHAVESARLEVSSKLLRLARIVRTRQRT